MTADPFSTARLRRAVLDAWTAHPPRFREDANAEEDNAHRYYRDRVVVELAQNAADAAARAGVPGRLALRLERTAHGARLVALNTGAPLDADGVASLASLRASAKRDGAAVGRFGVGFAAVRSVADVVTVASTSGAVHFDLAAARAALADVAPATGDDGGLAAEVARRGDALPVLRLPVAGPAPGHPASPPDGWDTAVVLALRDDVAVGRVRAELAAVDDVLLLALPALAEVEVVVDGVARTVRDVEDRWVVARGGGALDPALLADAPVEERRRTAWSVTWAARRAAPADGDEGRARPGAPGGGHTGVVHAPTPTDEPCTLPALLVATLPLDPSRRHVAPGPVTDAVVAGAGAVWADLLAACPREADAAGTADPGAAPARAAAPDPADLLPPALPAGPLDAALRVAVLAASRDVPLLPAADGGRVPPSAAAALPAGTDRALVRALAPWVAGLVDLAPHQRHLVGLLDVRTLELAEVVDGLPADPAALRALLDVVPADPRTLEQLATLPVALADGRTVRGARGLVLADGVPGDVLRVLGGWGVRVVHPDAAHPVLERLGAARTDAWGLLRHPAVRDRVLGADVADPADPADLLASELLADEPPGDEARAGTPGDDAAAVAHVVLRLVRAGLAAGRAPEADAGEPWWGELVLEAADGDRLPAGGLVVPGSDAARWFDPDVLPPVADHLLAAWRDEVEVVGVRSGLRVLTVPAADADVNAADEAAVPGLDGLDGWPAYLEDLAALDGPGEAATGTAADHRVVPDLDAVHDAAWPEVLVALAQGPARPALVGRVPLASGAHAPSYTAWWLRRRAPLGLGHPFLLPGAPNGPGRPGGPGARLLADLPPSLASLAGDEPVLRALGGVASLDELDASGWADVLDHLPDRGEIAPDDAAAVWRALAGLATTPGAPLLDPDRLPAWSRGRVVVARVDDVAVADPCWAQHPGVGPVLVVPASAADDVAAWLDVDLAAERAAGRVTSSGAPAVVPAAVVALAPGAPARWVEHEDLRVDGEAVGWWVADGVVHACTTRGLAHGLAHAAGRWADRDALERVLLDPDDLAAVLLERAGEP